MSCRDYPKNNYTGKMIPDNSVLGGGKDKNLPRWRAKGKNRDSM